MSIKGHNSVPNLQKVTGKILSGKEFLISIKGHNSVPNLQKVTGNNLYLDLVNICIYKIWLQGFTGRDILRLIRINH